MGNEFVTLFKFLDAKGAKALLENQTLKFTPLRKYNDPFEGENTYEFGLDVPTGNVVLNDREGKLRTLGHEPDMEAVHRARLSISTHSACCFCQRNDSLLLWSHYAEQHRGVCLQFEFQRFNNGVFDIERLPDGQHLLSGEVNYSKHRPVLLVNTDEASVVPYEMIDRSLFTKSLDWAYEEEWRFVMRNSPKVNFKRFVKDRLKRVIFGMRCQTRKEVEISRIVTTKYPHAVLAKAEKHQFKYAVEIKDRDKNSN